MQLISLTSNVSSFREVHFNTNGVNFIVARQKYPEKNDNEKTYNGVGKSLLVAIIHFCLGADKRSYKSFIDKLPDWSFVLTFQIKDIVYKATRSTNAPDDIILNDEELTLKKFNKKLENLCFDIPPHIGYLSFRSLLPFFIRPRRDSYVFYDKPSKTGSDYQKLLYNAFLLGLDIHLVKNKIQIRKEQERILKLSSNIKRDKILQKFFIGDRDITLTLKDLDDKIKKYEKDIKDFKVAEDYYEIKKQADAAELELFKVRNQITLTENQISNIDESLKISPDLNNNKIEKIYKEVNVIFPDILNKKIVNLIEFSQQITKNRIKRLSEQKQNLMISLDTLAKKRVVFEEKLDNYLKYLGAHQALDVFIKINDILSDLKNERDNLQKYDKLLGEYQKSNRALQSELLESTKQTDNYLTDMSSSIENLREYFRNLAKRFYPNVTSGITIYNNDKENRTRFDIEARIEADSSDGINKVKIFCYDLTILFSGFGHSMKFLFHDSRLFDGIDERQKAELFKILNELFLNKQYQYISTVNENQLEEVKRHLTTEDYENIIAKNTILTLTDDNDADKLLGIKIDIKYE